MLVTRTEDGFWQRELYEPSRSTPWYSFAATAASPERVKITCALPVGLSMLVIVQVDPAHRSNFAEERLPKHGSVTSNRPSWPITTFKSLSVTLYSRLETTTFDPLGWLPAETIREATERPFVAVDFCTRPVFAATLYGSVPALLLEASISTGATIHHLLTRPRPLLLALHCDSLTPMITMQATDRNSDWERACEKVVVDGGHPLRGSRWWLYRRERVGRVRSNVLVWE